MLFKNVKNAKELLDFFGKNLKYGFTSNGKIFLESDKDFQKNTEKYYKIRLGEDFIKSKYGFCWDFVELEQMFFKEKTFCITAITFRVQKMMMKV